MSKRAVLYARISSEDRDQFVPKLPDQLKMCSDYAQQRKYEIVADIVEEPNSSGTDPNLPGWLKLLDMINSGAVDVIVTRDPDRLTRDVDKFADISKVMKANNVRLDPVTRTYEAGHRGDFMMWLDVILADKDRKDLLERTERGKRNKVQAKRIYVNGIPPYGYKTHIVTEVVGDNVLVKERTLHVEPEEAEVVREIFAMYLSDRTISCTAIAKHLTEKGITPPGHTRYISESNCVPADAPWNQPTVTKILSRKTYCGTWEYGKTTNHKDGAIAVEVEPIVSKQVWNDAQAKMKTWRKSRVIKQTHSFILRNTAYCGTCGTPMSCRSSENKSVKGTKKRSFYYVCSRGLGKYHDTCDHRASYRADLADNDLWMDIQNVVKEPETLRAHFEKYTESLNNTDNHIIDKLVTKRKLVRKKQLAMDKLLDVYLDGRLSKTRYQARSDKLEADMNRHKAEVRELEADLDAKSKLEAMQHNLDQYIDEVQELLSKAHENDGLKAGFLRRLGIGIRMHTDNTSKFVDWSIFGNFNVRDASDSRLCFGSGFEPAQS